MLEDVTKDEFMAVMDILRSLKSMSTVQGRQQLVEIVTEQAELDQPLQVSPVCHEKEFFFPPIILFHFLSKKKKICIVQP